ncbi:MAG: fibronectin type III domain-containing protein [Chloroflexi bacterium]|nr:fibronectin type III domain-containing protein [Chloroflexota bacterium]
MSSSETQIDVAWTPPDDDPDAEPAAGASGSPAVGHGRITGYEVDVSDDGKTWSLLATVAGKLDEEYTYDEKTKKVTVNKVVEDTDVEFFHKGLVQGQTKYYRVSTINNAPSSSKRSVTSDVMNDMTLLSLVSDSPGGLVVKAIGYDTIELLWNARADDITAANIIGYKIESSPLNAAGDDCAENWSTLVEDTMSTTTSYTHTGLMPETGYCYRVFGINVVATSSGYVGYGDDYVTTNDNDAIATTDPAMAPGMPTAVTAMTVSDTQIDVSWTAPAYNGGAEVSGYVLERKSGDGEFMIIAATDVATWWNSLDCPMMNDAVPADADPAPGSDDETADPRSPYCYMYAGLSPEAKIVVDAAFANYAITGTSYSDMGLMEATKYYYRVSAQNSAGIGMPSDGMAYAMTHSSNTPPTTVGMIADVTVTVDMTSAPMDVSGYFSDPGDTLTYTAESSDDMIATAMVTEDDSDPGAITYDLTITGVSAGPATITVTATDSMGETATQPISVTVEAAAVELTAPSIISTNPVGSGLVTVTWSAVDGASGYTIIANSLTDPTQQSFEIVNNPELTTGQVGGLTAGGEYLIFVASFDPMGFELSDFVRITAE